MRCACCRARIRENHARVSVPTVARPDKKLNYCLRCAAAAGLVLAAAPIKREEIQ